MNATDKKNRLRRSMLFLSAQRPALIKDAYVYEPDCVIMDLEDAVALNQKDAARYSLFRTLTTIDYGDVERVVRINSLDTPFWIEDIRCCVAGGADAIRIAKCDSAKDVVTVEKEIEKAEEEFGREHGSTLLMAALETPRSIFNALEISESSDRMFGIAISGSDFRMCMHSKASSDGAEIFGARSHVVMAARAAGIQCFDTVFTDLDDDEGFNRELSLIKEMGFDGKSLISPKQIAPVHEVFAPTEKEINRAKRILAAMKESLDSGVGVIVLDGKMVDAPFVKDAQRVIRLAQAAGIR